MNEILHDKCWNCGRENAAGDNYCPGCGANLTQRHGGLTRVGGGQKGTGRVSFEADVERAQTDALARQIGRATITQHQLVSERIRSMRFLETDGSRATLDDPNNPIPITEFELQTENGRTVKIVGPHMEMTIT